MRLPATILMCSLLLVAWHSVFPSDLLKTNLLTVVNKRQRCHRMKISSKKASKSLSEESVFEDETWYLQFSIQGFLFLSVNNFNYNFLILFFLQFLTKCLLSGIFKISFWLLGTP